MYLLKMKMEEDNWSLFNWYTDYLKRNIEWFFLIDGALKTSLWKNLKRYQKIIMWLGYFWIPGWITDIIFRFGDSYLEDKWQIKWTKRKFKILNILGWIHIIWLVLIIIFII